jgi:hypothetical protein
MVIGTLNNNSIAKKPPTKPIPQNTNNQQDIAINSQETSRFAVTLNKNPIIINESLRNNLI